MKLWFLNVSKISEKKKENNWSLRENLKKEQQKQVFEVSFTNKTVKLRLEKPIKN